MPTYEYIGKDGMSVEKMDGSLENLKTGDVVETRKFYDHDDLTWVSDEPIWEPMAMDPTDINLASLGGTPYESSIDGFAGAVIPVPADAWWAYIMAISGTITVRRQTPDGPLEMKERFDAYPYVRIECAGTLTQLLVSGTGTFQIQMYRRPITD